ncbi:MAG: hypothetical protein AB7U82_01125 [Blastocatellales bacterium]
MTNLEAKQHLARKLDIDYSDIANNGLFSETDLQTFIQLGVIKAWDLHPWPFTQGKATGNTDNTGVTNGYYTHPSSLVNGSIFLLRVDGKEYKKLDFQDYLKLLEDYPSATERVYSEWQNLVYINKNSYTVGQGYEMYGKGFPITLSGANDLLPFSPTTDNTEYSGNEAIVLLAYAEALDSDKKEQPEQAEVERKKAYQTLNILWEPFAKQKALMQSKGRPMFNVPNYFGMNKNGSKFIGNFDYLN